jgi:hypothetical protein
MNLAREAREETPHNGVRQTGYDEALAIKRGFADAGGADLRVRGGLVPRVRRRRYLVFQQTQEPLLPMRQGLRAAPEGRKLDRRRSASGE